MNSWYLLYAGDSVDGRGRPQYIGRTTDEQEAMRYAYECTLSPYNIGRVIEVTDSSESVLRVVKKYGKLRREAL